MVPVSIACQLIVDWGCIWREGGGMHTGWPYFKFSCGFPRAVKLIVNLREFGWMGVPLALSWTQVLLGLCCNV